MLNQHDESRAVHEVEDRLVKRFPDLPAAVVGAAVRRSHEEFSGRPVRDFVPVLVERAARGALASSTRPV